jgi:cysteine dioxygenase
MDLHQRPIDTPTLPNTAALPEILQGLTGLNAPLSREQVCALLQELALYPEELAPYQRFDPHTYCRNRVFRNEFVDILVLCWRTSQRTPIHNHAGSLCGVYVLHGRAVEINFTPSGTGLLIPSRTEELSAGDLTVSYDADAHIVANLAAPAQDLVTLHCYSPPLTSMRIFETRETFLADYDDITVRATSSGCYHHGDTAAPPLGTNVAPTLAQAGSPSGCSTTQEAIVTASVSETPAERKKPLKESCETILYNNWRRV